MHARMHTTLPSKGARRRSASCSRTGARQGSGAVMNARRNTAACPSGGRGSTASRRRRAAISSANRVSGSAVACLISGHSRSETHRSRARPYKTPSPLPTSTSVASFPSMRRRRSRIAHRRLLPMVDARSPASVTRRALGAAGPGSSADWESTGPARPLRPGTDTGTATPPLHVGRRLGAMIIKA